jgi:hypothetical protein
LQEYVAVVIPQTFTGPVIVVGGVFPYTTNSVPGILPQAFTAIILIVPSVKDVAIVTVTEVVPAPELIVIPVGTDQLYDVAPNAGRIEYVAEVIPQIFEGPDMLEGVCGFLVTIKLPVVLVPQVLVAMQVIVHEALFPETVVVIEDVPCPEFIAIPAGALQV